nr:unnamed protein product [Callosobruchus analis]
MRVVALSGVFLFFTIIYAAPSDVFGQQDAQKKLKTTDKQLVQKQLDILKLYKLINQDCDCTTAIGISKNYVLENRNEDYTNAQAYENFLHIYQKGMLPKGHIFSIHRWAHLKQAIALFKVLYYAKDFDTFYKTAVWAKDNINEGIFVYALSVAIAHRTDTYGIIIPPIYEIFPYSFFDSAAVEKAQKLKETWNQAQVDKPHVIDANYSGYYLNLHPEQVMSHYTEDIGLNTFYWYTNIFYPSWLGGSEFKLTNDRRGEQHYYLLQQLLARYYLERLSFDMGEVPFIDWDKPLEAGYYPSLVYPNGLPFPSRPNFASLSPIERNWGQSWMWKSKFGYSQMLVKDYERRITDAVDSGFIINKNGKMVDLYTPEGFDILGNLIECNPDSPNQRFIGPIEVFAKLLVGYATVPLDKYHLAPSALEHFETASRDPAFYMILKRVVLLFQRYKSHLPPYTQKELSFPGVKVEDIKIDKLVTYFDKFESDVTNLVQLTPEEIKKDNVVIKVRQDRLNHKPFTYKIQVSSKTDQDASVRVFLGPKTDEYFRELNIQENRMNFIELDNFKYTLKAGSNTIEKSSSDSYWFVPDKTSLRDIFRKLTGALEGTAADIDASEAFYGFPNRLMLPIGRPEGFTFQLLVCLNPYKTPTVQTTQQPTTYYFGRVGTGMNYVDNYAFGFPLDRVMEDDTLNVPNCMFKDVTIYHEEDINSSL